MRVVMISKALVRASYRKKAEELAKFGDLQLAVIVPPYWQEGPHRIPLEPAQDVGYELVVSDVVFNGHFHLHFYRGLGQWLRRWRPDLLHVDEEPYNLATFQAIWHGRRLGAQVLFFAWQNIHRRLPLPFNLLEAYSLSRADGAIAGTPGAMAVLRAKGFAKPIAVIPQFGVDPQLYHPLREKRAATPHPFIIGYVGRLVREKGLTYLVEAVVGLEGDWRLVFLGEGPLRGQLAALAQQLGVSQRVTFRPPIPSAEIPEHLCTLDVLVLPSLTTGHWKEQFGRALIEAMACQVPVIGSDSGAIPEVIGEAGLVFKEADTQELRASLQRIMADEGLHRRLGELGRARVLARYTQAQIATQTYQVYRDTLGKK